MNIPFINLSWQEERIRESRERRFKDAIEQCSFVLGPDVEAFEKRFADYCGASHAIGVANGTDALRIIWQALGLERGDEVITIPTTYVATVSSLAEMGARPVFVDIDPATRNFDLDLFEKAITPKTKAILPVHLYGQMADMDAVVALARKHGLQVVEDACQAHGATFRGKRAGSFGIASAFSFYPGKNLGAYGDAGAIVTNDGVLADRMRRLRNHGGLRKYEHEEIGFNSRLDTLQAIVLDEKLSHLEEWNDMRRAIAARYDAGLGDVASLRLPPALPDSVPVHHLYVIELLDGDRDELIRFLADRGIQALIHYPAPVHLLPAFAYLGYAAGSFPEAEAQTSRIASLPLYPGMSEDETAHVIGAVREFCLR